MRTVEIKQSISLGMIAVWIAVSLSGCGYADELAENDNHYAAEEQNNDDTVDEVEDSVSYERPVSKPYVLVDQFGYQTEDVKKVLFLGENPADFFSVVECDTGEVIYTGAIHEKGYDETTDTYVSEGDFSELNKNGEYYIETERIGQSYPFSITKNPYDEQYERLYRELRACDFSRDCERVPEAAEVVANLLFTYEFFEKETDDQDAENMQDIPDLLKVAKNGCDAMKQCFNTATGGVTEGFGDEESEQASMEAGYSFAAAMAQFAVAYREYDETLSNQYMKTAEQAYAYCANKSEACDEQYYAASQLYKATGTKSYHDWMKNYISDVEKESVSSNDIYDISRERLYGEVVYLTTNNKVEQDICSTFMDRLLGNAETLAANAEKDYYLVCADKDRNVDTMLNNMYVLAVADHVIVSHEYLVILKEQIHYLNGRNSDCEEGSYSLVTKSALLFILGDMLHREENIS